MYVKKVVNGYKNAIFCSNRAKNGIYTEGVLLTKRRRGFEPRRR